MAPLLPRAEAGAEGGAGIGSLWPSVCCGPQPEVSSLESQMGSCPLTGILELTGGKTWNFRNCDQSNTGAIQNVIENNLHYVLHVVWS